MSLVKNLTEQYVLTKTIEKNVNLKTTCRASHLREVFLDKSQFKNFLQKTDEQLGLFEKIFFDEFKLKKFHQLTPLDVNRFIYHHQLEDKMAVSYFNPVDICFFLEEYLSRAPFKLLLVCEKNNAHTEENYHWFFLLLKFDLKEKKTIYQILNFSSLSQDYLLKKITLCLDQSTMMSKGEYKLSAYENFYDETNPLDNPYRNFHYALETAYRLKLITEEILIEKTIKQEKNIIVDIMIRDIIESTASFLEEEIGENLLPLSQQEKMLREKRV
jgi:hypothetical protein